MTNYEYRMMCKLWGLVDLENERLLNVVFSGEVYNAGWITRYYIIPNVEDISKVDISACMEDTLHRMIDAGWTDREIQNITGLKKLGAYDDQDEFTFIDLDYAHNGEIVSADIGLNFDSVPYSICDDTDTELEDQLPFC